jgi:agmatinase
MNNFNFKNFDNYDETINTNKIINFNSLLKKKTHVFIGCESEYRESEIVIFGAPFDGTASYRPGARFAPAAIRSESYSIETYSPYLDRDLTDIEVFDGGDLELALGNTERVLKQIETCVQKIMSDDKLPVMLGGEHLITFGAARAAYKKYPELCIVHFDAHADMRDNYLGEKLSHATVMRRCHDLLGDRRIFQFGIRSGEREEFLFSKKHNFINKFDFNNLSEVLNILSSRNLPVYFSLDLDILDPADFPGTGTPEAGGVNFKELLEAVIDVCDLNIVGVDINELSPPYDPSGRSTSLACKILREILLAL